MDPRLRMAKEADRILAAQVDISMIVHVPELGPSPRAIAVG